jgi:hypothetical protein
MEVAMTILSAAQHRDLARNLLAKADTPGHPSKADAARMARYHEIMAKLIEREEKTPPVRAGLLPN